MKTAVVVLLLVSGCFGQEVRFSRENKLFWGTAAGLGAVSVFDAATTSHCQNEYWSAWLYSPRPAEHPGRVWAGRMGLSGAAVVTSWGLKRMKAPRVVWMAPMVYVGGYALKGGIHNTGACL